MDDFNKLEVLLAKKANDITLPIDARAAFMDAATRLRFCIDRCQQSKNNALSVEICDDSEVELPEMLKNQAK